MNTEGLLELPTEKVIEFPYRIYPKQRARSNHATGAHYTPTAYRQWLVTSRDYLKQQWGTMPCHLMYLQVDVRGKQKGDLDNMLGGLLDAMVHAGIVVDDDAWNIPSLQIQWNDKGRDEPPAATIYISNIDYFPREKPQTKTKRKYNRRVKH